MDKVYKILIACGTGIATSTVIAVRVQEMCEKNGYKVKVEQCKVTEVDGLAKNYDLVVASTKIPPTVTTPYVLAIPYLTGVGMEKTDKEVLDKLAEVAAKDG